MILPFGTILSLAVLGEASPAKRAGSASAFCSNSGGNYRLSSIAAPVQGSGNPGSESTWQLSIDDTSSGHKQTIAGFGAAVTDATVSSFNTLSGSTLQELLNELMTSAGADFALMRHTIGTSDLSGDPVYTYDDNGGNADPSMSGFNLGGRGNAMARMLAKMKSLQSNLKIIGSPWSAPGWMKLNGVIDGNTNNNNLNDGYLTSGGTGSTGYSSAFADYFVRYIQAYEAQGAHIDAITIQNEPLNSQSGYPTMYVYDYESAQLIQNYVGPALAGAGLDTDIWAYDHNTGKDPSPMSSKCSQARRAVVSANCPRWSRAVCQLGRMALLCAECRLDHPQRFPQRQPVRAAVHDRMLDPALRGMEPSRRLHHGSSAELGVWCDGLDTRDERTVRATCFHRWLRRLSGSGNCQQ